jgi:Kef-type K+ transport system membrane component KefB
MGVTVAMDVLIIILFTLALALSKIIMAASSAIDYQTFIVLSLAVADSLLLGVFTGKCISFYIKKVGHDLPLFLLFVAFGVFKTSLWLNHFMEAHFATSLHLEPLLICMSAGFTVQNFSKTGRLFMESLDYVSLPIYVLFFSLAGASLNLEALCMTWPLAGCLVLVRITGIFAATWFAGTLNKDSADHRRAAWMAYITQAGVAIGLAQLAERHFPEIGMYLTTVVLAVITVNQVVGPITFKMALNMVGETGKK